MLAWGGKGKETTGAMAAAAARINRMEKFVWAILVRLLYVQGPVTNNINYVALKLSQLRILFHDHTP